MRHFHDDPGYIDALAQQVQAHWQQNGRAQKLLMSFHGVPRFTLDKGDPYHCECLKTGRLLAERLGLTKEQYVISFQSRFGRAEWLQPYTSATFEQLGKQGCQSLDVICPGFVGDCLETLEEIAMEGKHTFQHAGGGEFRYIPCLNDSPHWIAALADLVEKNLQGWQEVIEQDATLRQQRAQALGASC